MHYLKYLPLIFFSGCLLSDKAPFQNNQVESYPGMAFIHASGKNFFMGSNGSYAAQDEKPPMQVSFTYDFYIDKYEVTQGDYLNVMGRNPVSPLSPHGYGDSLPVYLVSWYDAILYCNALSVLNNMDTVYTYSNVKFTKDGSAFLMDNLNINLSVKGYRLPTEAEWEYAARAGSNTTFFWGDDDDLEQAKKYAWFQEPFMGNVHPVGKLQPNTFGLYDMAGNIMEWTNDIKTTYQETHVSNLLGEVQYSTVLERPVKGGSYMQDIHSLRSSNRKDVYSTFPAVTAAYLGFRCALGSIENGLYLSSSGVSTPSNPVQITQTMRDISAFTGNTNLKICFVNRSSTSQNLFYVDFSTQSPKVIEIQDTLPVYHPTISPDGQFVAFCTKSEGIPRNSSIYIRPIDSYSTSCIKLPDENAFIPRWWVDTVAADTFLIFTSSAIDNKNESNWMVSKTFKRKVRGGIPTAELSILSDSGSYHDGLSKDGNILVSGTTRLLIKNLKTSTARHLFIFPSNGKNEEGSTQVCNVSLSPTVPLKIMFLDFGYNGISRITGNSYGIHENIFIINEMGEATSHLPKPTGEHGWNHSEWSNHPNFAISSATNMQEESHAVYLIDVSKSSSLPILSGVNLMYPSLWIGPSINNTGTELNLDSCGQYVLPTLSDVQALLAMKMKRFWNMHNDLEVVFVGDSKVADGIDPRRFKHHKGYNFAVGAGDLATSINLIENYILTHCPNIKIIAIPTFMGWLGLPSGDFSWEAGFSKSRGFQFDKNNSFWESGLPMGFKTIVASVPDLYPGLPMDELGLLKFKSVGWGIPHVHGANAWRVKPPSEDWGVTTPAYIENFNAYKNLVKELQSRKIHLLIVNMPNHPEYNATPYYSEFGPIHQTANQIIQNFIDLDKASAYTHFYDAHLFGTHDYTDADAFDCAHLSEQGAGKLSDRIDSLMTEILAKKY